MEEHKRMEAERKETEEMWEQEYDKLYREYGEMKQQYQIEKQANQERGMHLSKLETAFDEAGKQLAAQRVWKGDWGCGCADVYTHTRPRPVHPPLLDAHMHSTRALTTWARA